VTIPVGIIGGSALAQCAGLADVRTSHPKTPFGRPSGPLSRGRLAGCDVFFLMRHGPEPRIAPHRINYRANLRALYDLGCESVIGVAAVGGITSAMTPGQVVVPDQIIDYTWGRTQTFYDDDRRGALDHVDFTYPYSRSVRQALVEGAHYAGISVEDYGVHGVTQGPRLETAAEINRLANDGCDIVGMTGMPEAGLARELGIAYGCLGIVVNGAAGRTGNDTIHGQIGTRLERAAIDAEAVVGAAVAML